MAISKDQQKLNVYGKPLEICGKNPMTGFFRTGDCQTGSDDSSVHTVCAELTIEFLEFSKTKGNDLMTPLPQFGFPGLKPGQRWCLCAARWLEAANSGKAPPVHLDATHEKTLQIITLDQLLKHKI